MRNYEVDVLGHACLVNVVETDADLEAFRRWVEAHVDEWVAVDTESTGLDLYSSSWKLRMVQFGTVREAWVLWLRVLVRWLRSLLAVGLCLRCVVRWLITVRSILRRCLVLICRFTICGWVVTR